MLFESANLRVPFADGIATLTLDFAGAQPNQFSLARLAELESAWNALERNTYIETLVIRSANAAGFCAGYDADSIASLDSQEEAREFALAGQRLFDRIANAPFLTLASLHGPIHDAGLDLALACDYRLAIATPSTSLGFPGLQHGMLSPWGGLTRLTRLLGAVRTVELLMADEPLTAREAVRSGLVDHAFCERRANIDLQQFLQQLQRRPRKPRRWHTPLDGWAARRVVAAYDSWRTPHVAAAAALAIVPQAATGEAEGQQAERVAFAALQDDDVARAALMIHRDERALRDVGSPIPDRIAIVGDPLLVADLVREYLLKGHRVDLVAIEEWVDVSAIEQQLSVACQRGRVTPLEADQARARLQVHRDLPEMKYDAVLLIAETATALELAETLAKPLAPILAMTSDFAEFCDLTSRPRNLIGLHRVAGRRFVELLRSQEAAPAILERAGTWLAACGQTAIVTSKSPLVQSLQLVWWDEAVRLVADGFAIDIVDAAAALLGAERGPLESLDRVGLESVVAQLPRVKPLLAAGIRGRPHCEGFYVITDDSPTCANAVAQLVLLEAAPARHRPRIAEPVDAAAARRYCRERLLARLTVGAIARLRRDPYASAAEIDLAVVRGLGLCAASGGVLRLADRLGLQCVVESLRELRASCGERFKPPRDLLRCVALGATFHGESAELDATAPLMRCA